MTGTAALVYDESLTAYDFGPRHPLAPVRVRLTVALARALGVLPDAYADEPDLDDPDLDAPDAPESPDDGELRLVVPPSADDALLGTVHTPDYLAAVRRASRDPREIDLDHGLGTPDDPTFEGMHEASAHIVGASVEAARQVWSGRALHAANIAGGLHHAMPSSASGFCIYNDPAIAIRWLLDQGCPKVAYVDTDVHHGDGVQAAFYDEPRVLTISLHESPMTLFPAVTGYPSEIGEGAAEGTAANVALPVRTTDAGWLRAFHATVPALLEAYRPTVLFTQHGCDSHALDPLAHLALTVDGQRAAAIALHELAHRHCEGRWIATGGGGYALVEVVPRAWTHLLGVLADRPVDPELATPDGWRSLAARLRPGTPVPTRMTDGGSGAYDDWSHGYDPASPLDQAILATRRAVFPAHGLDPEF